MALPGVAGVLGNSVVMIADAAHSLSDLVSDAVTLVVLREAQRPPDLEHPYGHGKFESLGAYSLAAILILTGGGIGLHAFHILQEMLTSTANVEIPTTLALWAAVVSVLVKEALFHATVKIGNKYNSKVVVLNAWHHRADGLSSLVALIGIIAARWGFPIMDPIAGLVVAAMIIRIGVKSGLESIEDLTDKAVGGELLEKFEALLKKQTGIVSYHQPRLRRMGPSVVADVGIIVDPFLSVSAANQIAERTRQRMLDEMPELSEILIHVLVPGGLVDYSSDRPKSFAQGRTALEIERDVRALCSSFPLIILVRRVTCHFLPEQGLCVQVKVLMAPGITIEEASSAALKLETNLIEEIPEINFVEVYLDLLHHGVTAEGLVRLDLSMDGRYCVISSKRLSISWADYFELVTDPSRRRS